MSEQEFTITRVFDAPRELVFQSWIEPEQVARWWGPRDFTTPLSTISMDVRPEGSWRATMVADADGSEYPIGGVFREVVPPERLVFTWGGVDDPDHGVVTVALADIGGKTEMTFHMAGIGGQPGDDNVYDGWSECLDRLGEHLARV